MENRIGDIVTLPDGRKAEVVEGRYVCHGCALYNIPCIDMRINGTLGRCASGTRTDHKNIIYKEIKEE